MQKRYWAILCKSCVMDELIMLAGGVGRLVAIFGGALSAVFIAWAGVLWMFSAGDPQAMAKARMALIGVVVGLVVIGASFLVPGIVSEVVIEPAGGLAVDVRSGFDCDGVLRAQLVTQVNVNSPARMQGLVQRIQGQRDECHSALWSPRVRVDEGPSTGCARTAEGGFAVEGMSLPDSLQGSRGGSMPGRSLRDRYNNIMVYWDWVENGEIRNLPSDSASCWLYVDEYKAWYSGRAN